MHRDSIDFDTFRDNYIAHAEGGFYPVYSKFEESHNGNNLRVVQMDMICEWRLDDGKIRFIEVPFDTEDQFNQIVAYLKACAGYLNAAILERIDELKFADTVEEDEEEDDESDD
jgi:hypothetical protein